MSVYSGRQTIESALEYAGELLAEGYSVEIIPKPVAASGGRATPYYDIKGRREDNRGIEVPADGVMRTHHLQVSETVRLAHERGVRVG